MTPNTNAVAPQEVREHPFASLLRTTFHDIELLADNIEGLDEEEIASKLFAIRDTMKPVLYATSDEATPLLSQILPVIQAAYDLIDNGCDDSARDLLHDLTRRFTPSPSVGGNR